MSRMLLTASVVALALFGWLPDAAAQDTKTVRGTASSVSADSVAVTVAGHEMKFAVDSHTNVIAAGAGTKTAAAQAAGRTGAPLDTLVKTGQPVEVSYRETGGIMHATRIRAVSSASSPNPNAGEQATGKVTAVSATSLTISGSRGPATFTQTFSVDASTKVFGRGAGTLAKSKGGRIQLTDYVSTGDSVNVSYRKSGDALHASEVRVMK